MAKPKPLKRPKTSLEAVAKAHDTILVHLLAKYAEGVKDRDVLEKMRDGLIKSLTRPGPRTPMDGEQVEHVDWLLARAQAHRKGPQ